MGVKEDQPVTLMSNNLPHLPFDLAGNDATILMSLMSPNLLEYIDVDMDAFVIKRTLDGK